jgi:hypothetical protein
MKTITLKVGGKVFDPNPPSPKLLAIVAYLDKKPADELMTGDQLAAALKTSRQYVDDLSRHPRMSNYQQKTGKCRYFGNPKAIAELRRQVGA